MTRKILFVDDDPILRIAMEKHVAGFCNYFTMVVAADGFEAVKKLEETAFSLIIVDLIMPRMDGMSLINHIQGIYPDIPIIIVAEMAAEEMERIAKVTGAMAHFSKPFQMDDLVSAVMGSLRREADGGIMNDVSPTVFLQLMEMDCKTCTIRIMDKVTEKGGVLYFLDGQLLDARIGTTKGIDAAYTVFTWDVVTIFVGNECAPRENIINSDLQPIIMKAVGMKDESGGIVFSFDADARVEEFAMPDLTDKEELIKAKKRLMVHKIRELLVKELSDTDGLKNISHDESLKNVVTNLAKIGNNVDFGDFRVGGIVSGGETDRVLLPMPPATVLHVGSDCSTDEICKIFMRRKK